MRSFAGFGLAGSMSITSNLFFAMGNPRVHSNSFEFLRAVATPHEIHSLPVLAGHTETERLSLSFENAPPSSRRVASQKTRVKNSVGP